MIQPQKVYLGDSVYAEISHDCLRLTTENGSPSDPSNRIWLGEEELTNLLRFLERWKESRANGTATRNSG